MLVASLTQIRIGSIAGTGSDLRRIFFSPRSALRSRPVFTNGVFMILRPAIANENHWEREGTTSVVPQERRTSKRL